MKYTYIPNGVCSRSMTVEIEDNIITDCKIIGGCSGNLQGICKLVQGMDAETAISKLKGIRCGARPTSCPDQLATCIEEALENM